MSQDRYSKQDSDASREALNNRLIHIEHLLTNHIEKFQSFTQHCLGKPMNGEAIDPEGGLFGRLADRLKNIEEKQEEFDKSKVSKIGLGVYLAAASAIWYVINILVWTHKVPGVTK